MVNQPVLKYFQCPNPTVETGMHAIACHQWGEKNNPRVVICVHGLARNGRDFDFLAQSLADECRVLAFDMPGRGKSDWLPDPLWYNPGTYIADILHILQTLGVEEVDWIGTSMGGIIAMLLASQANGLMKRMVLNDIGPFLSAQAIANIAAYVTEGGNAHFHSREQAAAFLKDIYQAKWGLHDPALWRHFVKHSLRQEADGKWRLHYDPAIAAGFRDEKKALKPPADVDMWGTWEKIACPVFLMRGAESQVLTRETAEKMRRGGTIAQFAEIQGCAHAPSLMEDEQIALIKKWLR